MSKDTPWALIAKYLSGECTKAERIALDKWLEDEANYKEFREIEVSWRKQKQSNLDSEFEVKHGLERLRKPILKSTKEKAFITDRQISQKISRYQWAIGALVLLIVVSFGLFFTDQAVMYGEDEVLVKKETLTGETKEFILPDGSSVWLNELSSICYMHNFSEDLRVVELSGEAFFDVVPNAAKPFIVRSQNVSTKVLGTSFNVSAYAHDSVTKISVASGRVSVRKEKGKKDEELLQLTPKQELVINKKNEGSYMSTVSIESIARWRENRFVFRDNSFREVMQVLSHHFGVEIVAESDQLLDCRVMMSFTQETSLTEIMELLSISNEFSYTFQNGLSRIIISGGSCR